MSEAEFIAAVLILYTDLPDTPLRPTATDQATAHRLFADGVSLPLIESALLLGLLRRLHRDPSLPALSAARSLAYFRPIIEELRLQPLPKATSTTSGSSCAGRRHARKNTLPRDR